MGSDIESFSEEEEEEEVSNFCFMAINDEFDEVFDASNEHFSNLELQNAFDGLVGKFQKVCVRNKAFKKIVTYLKKKSHFNFKIK